jgi:hypothetical protein
MNFAEAVAGHPSVRIEILGNRFSTPGPQIQRGHVAAKPALLAIYVVASAASRVAQTPGRTSRVSSSPTLSNSSLHNRGLSSLARFWASFLPKERCIHAAGVNKLLFAKQRSCSAASWIATPRS